MLLLFVLVACTSTDDAPVVDGSDDSPGTTDASATTGDTAPDTVVLPLDLQILSVDQAPGVLHVHDRNNASDWSIDIEGQTFEAGSDGIVAIYGYPQGSTLSAQVMRFGETQTELTLPIPAHNLPWTVTVHDAAASEVDDGVLAVGLVGREGIDPELLVLQGAAGEVLWWHPVEVEWDFSAVAPSAEGGGFVWLEIDSDRSTSDARMVELTLDGRYYTQTGASGGHHVGIEPEPGRYAFLALDVRADAPAPDGTTFDPASDIVVEIDAAGGGNRAELVNVMDDLFQSENDWICEHSGVREDAYGHDDLMQWTHGNSLVHLPDSDAYLVYLRWVDTLMKIGRDGTYHWSLSGPWSDFTAPDGSPLWLDQDQSSLWSHGHFTDGWETGVLMYDNGNHNGQARVVELAYDETARTAEVVATYLPPDERIHHVLGDARRLPGGNVLVSWTVLGLMQEFSPDGTVVWEAKGDAGIWFNRVLFATDIQGLATP